MLMLLCDGNLPEYGIISKIRQKEFMMADSLSKSAQRFKDALQAQGLSLSVVEFPESTRTSQEAADAIGCALGQIAKTLVFTRQSGVPVLIVASGANRVNEKAVKALLGEKIEKADADYVSEHTGFAIGGIPPAGHAEKIETFIDEDLLGYEVIWAAAGTPHAVFKLKPGELVEMTGGKVISIQ
jgi:prolyl-tRNA editing enzyme YbaK/EbsC (Cys-tRNA(Pro) deacylase)